MNLYDWSIFFYISFVLYPWVNNWVLMWLSSSHVLFCYFWLMEIIYLSIDMVLPSSCFCFSCLFFFAGFIWSKISNLFFYFFWCCVLPHIWHHIFTKALMIKFWKLNNDNLCTRHDGLITWVLKPLSRDTMACQERIHVFLLWDVKLFIHSVVLLSEFFITEIYTFTGALSLSRKIANKTTCQRKIPLKYFHHLSKLLLQMRWLALIALKSLMIWMIDSNQMAILRALRL